jgi:predicted amidohydrolase YtcJ
MKFKTGLLVLGAFIAGVWVLFSIATRSPEGPAHQVFVNGTVITMDDSNPMAEAISIREGVIERVGRSEEILATIDDDTDVVDLRGRALLPGFIDAHGHFPGSGQVVFSADLQSPPIGDIETIDGLLARLREHAANRPEGWITGFGYDDTLLAEGRHPTREDLDRVSADRPIAISHVSGHLAVVNSAGLAALNMDSSTADPEGGRIVRDADGRPTGVLEETASRLAMNATYDIGLSDLVRMTTTAAQEYLSVGVTTASAGGMPGSLANGLGLMSRFNVFPQRVALFPLFEEVGEDLLAEEVTLEDFSGGRVSVPRVKLIADGSIQGFTGYLSEPYYTPYHGDENYRGYASVSREDLFSQVKGLYERKIRFAIHTNGDQSIEDALDAIEAASAEYPWPEARPLLIHAQMARSDQIDRMAALGVTPSFFPSHTYYWGDRHADIFLGPERAAVISPARWAIERGVRFSAHSDTPVTPMLPMQIVWSQTERKTTSGRVLGPEQRIDRMAALRAITLDAAWQVFLDDKLGSIEPGKVADLVVLSGNPLTEPDVRELVVERVLIGGAEVYSRH